LAYKIGKLITMVKINNFLAIAIVCWGLSGANVAFGQEIDTVLATVKL
jgi:hypothetical protein